MGILQTFTTSTDFTSSRSKTIRSWHISQGAGAQTINFRDGGASGTVKFAVQLAANSSNQYGYPKGAEPVAGLGWYVEIVGTGIGVVSVDFA